LNDRLKNIRKVFDPASIVYRDSANPEEISRYYRKNRLAYRLFNSHDGFVHMGISSNGKFSTRDFYEQALIVHRAIKTSKTKKVLELAPGKAATIKYLAQRNPKVEFHGIDLKDGQLEAKNTIKNLKLDYGDYHDLSRFADESMDLIYVIEALCHASNKQKVISEAKRVLRQNGRLIIIDGYYSKKSTELSPDQNLACRLVAKSMMVTDKNQTYEYLINSLKKEGFEIDEEIDYSKSILPSLYRLESKAKKLFERPRLAKFITKVVGEIVTANAIAGYLMPICIQEGLFEYRYTLAMKTK
ncbi:MAG: class I SAM-dependent methyltransferase, partial [Candidatus Saccharimonadales bacterium]